ncbi:aminodeoxychorismate synthase, subunit I /aminodeoxychorismate synthase, glutamine amidotransferase subunit [Stackebrandtia albiflava]|uniref:aminodeoxychorismate synthase n=1 Tax=Stackebrandtia albiflava TaxID=406432 RepID=A0A562VCH5_9ACTN|nr:aminodeoxychorismate synthase component I [Stackebrandtia albiflava]TWJ15579.1 aminodeoxychorismate synthase, subunit I /aminodeoxychorismate synthase, glutamine amidotransferase subunit [Stackebrandtia albiflava]
MRVLLIDNHDSYTYNLYQLLATELGCTPVVMTHDDPRLLTDSVAAFDVVVVSPGPGRPQRPSDLGHVRHVLDAHPGLPTLGVCLGHQALAHLAGARVVTTRPRHGHPARVYHDGTGLFRGVPDGFTAIRYHSLHVARPLPEPLREIAVADDDTVMAVRHLGLPRWGVQFHPESVATEHGARLVRNFADLAAPGRRPATIPAPRSGSAPRRERAAGREPVLAVATLDRAVSTPELFRRRFGDSSHAFWLDSSLAEPGRARFSFLGDTGGPLGQVLRYRVGSGAVQVTDAAGTRDEPGDVFQAIRRRLERFRHTGSHLPFDLTTGMVGYFGYELKADCGGDTAHAASTPDAMWLLADRLVAVDHQEDRTYVVALSTPDPDARRIATDWTTRTAAALTELPDPAPSAPPPVSAAGDRAPVLAREEAGYLADVESCLAELRAGESYEICLTNRVTLDPVADPLDYHLALRRRNPAPYAAYLRLGEFAVMSSSPERFIRVHTDGTVESRPIKGTVARHPDPVLDEAGRASLTASAKTRAENLMIVDLLRNDLGRVCDPGSVTVPEFLVTETYATVHQLVSTVRGRLPGHVSPVDCVRACFPGGSMTGAPKLRTMRIIDRLEGRARGVYSGALGYFGFGGGADLSIVIRTAVWEGSELTVGTGGAVVLDSDPAEEFAETMVKAAALVAAREDLRTAVTPETATSTH